MKEYTVRIPEDQSDFFLELLAKLGFHVVSGGDMSITDAQKQLILDRISNSKKAEMLDWDKVQDDFVF
ncbi:MAG: hypothetical protein RLZZ519_3410 [Bacteroidota bacterium]|jgi:hypothetical protein